MEKRFVLFGLLFFLFFIPRITPVYAEKQAGSSAMITKALPDAESDQREKILKSYLEFYNSPLAPSAKTFVQAADTYGLDWKLLVAISGVESTFGHQLQHNSHNAWGWGIYGTNMIVFNSYDEAIETISKSLRENYIEKWGAKDVYQIGRIYAASPTWAQGVVYFMGKIEEFGAKDPDSLSISL